MATLEEINAYYNDLYKAFESKQVSSFYNKNRTHNATIMRLMFEKSSSIDMYCGSLSVLREFFYEKIAETDSKEVADMLKDGLRKAFMSFLSNRDARANIIFEYVEKDFRKDLIVKESFCDAELKGQLKVYYLDDRLTFKKELSHFCVSNSNIMRFEQGKLTHSAICTIHDVDSCDKLRKNFDALKSFAKPF